MGRLDAQNVLIMSLSFTYAGGPYPLYSPHLILFDFHIKRCVLSVMQYNNCQSSKCKVMTVCFIAILRVHASTNDIASLRVHDDVDL